MAKAYQVKQVRSIILKYKLHKSCGEMSSFSNCTLTTE